VTVGVLPMIVEVFWVVEKPVWASEGARKPELTPPRRAKPLPRS
jgi:hypothetical protein